ncbi:hypothetical protein QJS66_06350 [Kocuria rhizophila]|nr:hypothetical protein QJS66_06350 [Kocuria rhizophila]
MSCTPTCTPPRSSTRWRALRWTRGCPWRTSRAHLTHFARTMFGPEAAIRRARSLPVH